MTAKVLIIIGVVAAIAIIFVAIIAWMGISQQNFQEEDYVYEIRGKEGGAGSHTKTDLIFARTSINDPSYTSTVDLTKDLHYTDHILFSDWQIHSFENFVFVTWITSEQSWSDVFLALSDDYGKTFEIKNISQSRDYNHQYQLQIVKDNLYLAWQEEFHTPDRETINQIYFAKSGDLGKSFSEPLILSTPNVSGYEFDLEANDEIALVIWREDFEDANDPSARNIFFAQIFDREEDNLLTFPALRGSHFDFEIHDDVLHGAWSSVEDNDRIIYGYSEDYGVTFPHTQVIFDADWQTSPYAPIPVPKITVDDKVTIEWKMHNEKGEETPYKVIIEE